jgi:hypothetical protein
MAIEWSTREFRKRHSKRTKDHIEFADEEIRRIYDGRKSGASAAKRKEGAWQKRGRNSGPFFKEEGISNPREKLRLQDG